MKHICATLLVLCSTPDIENKFIEEVKEKLDNAAGEVVKEEK